MKSLIRCFAITSLLLVAMVWFPALKPTHADWDCDLTLNQETQACAAQETQCVTDALMWGTGTVEQCHYEYQVCLSDTQAEKSDCEFVNGGSPNPWPVINQHFQWCLEGCAECSQIDNLFERFQCNSSCQQFCRDNYPRS